VLLLALALFLDIDLDRETVIEIVRRMLHQE
jgi:hypothetical protein